MGPRRGRVLLLLPLLLGCRGSLPLARAAAGEDGRAPSRAAPPPGGGGPLRRRAAQVDQPDVTLESADGSFLSDTKPGEAMDPGYDPAEEQAELKEQAERQDVKELEQEIAREGWNGSLAEAGRRGPGPVDAIASLALGEDRPRLHPDVRLAVHCISAILNLIILGSLIYFMVQYKRKVVDFVPVLEPRSRPQAGQTDFKQGICDCAKDKDMCLHAFCCCWCRVAHTWHVAGVCEYWPAIFLLLLAHLARLTLCLDIIIFTYFRMKLKDSLGIRPDVVWDCIYTAFCPCCAVAQEALAVDEELGAEVHCCFRLGGLRAVGSQANAVQLRDGAVAQE